LLTTLSDLVAWLDSTKMPAMIIGGVAPSILGRPRLTQDVNALAILPETDWGSALSAGARHGIMPRIDNALDFAQRSRVLLLRHTETGIDVDLVFGRLAFERAAIDNSAAHIIGGVRVRLPRVEDLIIMKAVARRPKDLLDIEGLLAAHPETDLVTVRRWVGEFAAATSMPDMLEDFDKLVGRLRSGP
jgi:hypothetical protein